MSILIDRNSATSIYRRIIERFWEAIAAHLPVFKLNVREAIPEQTILELTRHDSELTVGEHESGHSEAYVADETIFCGTGVQMVAMSERR